MTDSQLIDILRRLRRVRSGIVFEAHECRAVFRDATKIETRLQKRLLRVSRLKKDAEEAFVTGWPEATDAPWRID